MWTPSRLTLAGLPSLKCRTCRELLRPGTLREGRSEHVARLPHRDHAGAGLRHHQHHADGGAAGIRELGRCMVVRHEQAAGVFDDRAGVHHAELPCRFGENAHHFYYYRDYVGRTACDMSMYAIKVQPECLHHLPELDPIVYLPAGSSGRIPDGKCWYPSIQWRCVRLKPVETMRTI